MKKLKLFLVVVFVTLTITACGGNKAITSDEFKSKMESKNFTIYNTKSQFASYDQVKEALLAYNEEKDYKIEFYILDTKDSAKIFYKTNKENFEEEKEGLATTTSVDLNNKNRYTQADSNTFKLISRIDNTVIYVNVNKEYKEDVSNILKELGY